MISFSNRSAARWMSGAAIAALAFSGAACGEEEGGEGGSVRDSPVHAIASVLQVNDSVGELTVARLILVSTAGGAPRFVDSATDTSLNIAGTKYDLNPQRVRLLEEGGADPVETTFYTLTSRQSSALVYEAEGVYRFEAVVEDAELAGARAGQTFTITVQAPTVTNNVERVSDPQVNTRLDIATPDSFEAGIIEVQRGNNGQTTWVSYPYDERFLIDAQHAIESKADLLGVQGGVVTVPSDAFKRNGTHLVTFVGLDVEDNTAAISPNLGVHSVGFAGAAATIQVDVP